MGASVTKCAPVKNLDNQVWYHNINRGGFLHLGGKLSTETPGGVFFKKKTPGGK